MAAFCNISCIPALDRKMFPNKLSLSECIKEETERQRYENSHDMNPTGTTINLCPFQSTFSRFQSDLRVSVWSRGKQRCKRTRFPAFNEAESTQYRNARYRILELLSISRSTPRNHPALPDTYEGGTPCHRHMHTRLHRNATTIARA